MTPKTGGMIRQRGKGYQWQHSFVNAAGERVFINGTEKTKRLAQQALRALDGKGGQR